MDLFWGNLLSPPPLPFSLPLLSYHHPPINSFPVQSQGTRSQCVQLLIHIYSQGRGRNVQVGANMSWKQTPA